MKRRDAVADYLDVEENALLLLVASELLKDDQVEKRKLENARHIEANNRLMMLNQRRLQVCRALVSAQEAMARRVRGGVQQPNNFSRRMVGRTRTLSRQLANLSSQIAMLNASGLVAPIPMPNIED